MIMKIEAAPTRIENQVMTFLAKLVKSLVVEPWLLSQAWILVPLVPLALEPFGKEALAPLVMVLAIFEHAAWVASGVTRTGVTSIIVPAARNSCFLSFSLSFWIIVLYLSLSLLHFILQA